MGSSSDGSEAIAWLAILVIGLAVFAIVGVVAAIVWFIMAAVARAALMVRLRARAGEEFDYTMQQKGLTLPVEDSIDVLYAGGLEFTESGGLDAFDVLVYATGSDEVDT